MEPENRRETILGVRVELQDWNQDQGQAELMAYAFGPNGKLVATAPLYLEDEGSSMGLAKLALEIESPEEICIKVGPPVENPKLLARHQPAVESLVVEPGVQGVLEMQLPPEAWGCWVRFAYLVTGTVRKSEEGPNPPICSGEVEIYDVDPAYCLLRLPDPVIEKLQGAMVDLLLDPPPFDLPEIPRLWPELREEKLPIQPPEPPKESEIRERLEQLPGDWGFARERFENLSLVGEKLDHTLETMTLAQRQEWLASEAVEGVQVSKLLYSSPSQFRNLLADNYPLFRYWLCYPWIYWLWWPYCYWYSLEKLGTARLQPDGTFSEVVWLSICRKDRPDLWFVVRQSVNGVERVIYARYPVPCNTYWNHPSGDPVHLLVTDPRAVACHEEPDIDLDPASRWVISLAIGNHSLKRIYGTGAGSLPADAAKIGLYESASSGVPGSLATFHDGPFGGTLAPRLLFSPALEAAGIKYYRLKTRVNGSGDWTALDHEVVRHYSHLDAATSTLEFRPYHLGPQTVGSENTLFEIPPVHPPNKATQPTAAWYVIDAKVDLANGYIDSKDLADGYVELKLELFDAAGARVDPAGNIALKLPSNNDIRNNVSTSDAAAVNPALVVADPEDPAFQTLIYRLQIDNRKPTAIIDAPAVVPSGGVSDACGMVRYQPADTSVTLGYQARHPRRFAMYSFSIVRGTTHVYSTSGQAGDGGASGQFFVPAPTNGLGNLLSGCPEAAFSENLYVRGMAHNGWNRVGPDASAVRAFALAKKP